jgi:PRTRC genetic system protein B
MNNTLTNKKMAPSMAIVVYQDKAQYSPSFFLEKREIKMIGDKFTLMAPVPMSDDTLKDIAKVYMKTRSAGMSFGGLIAPQLLFAMNKPNKTAVIWHQAAVKRSLNFSASLKIKNASEVFVPALLFAVLNKTLYIFSLMESDRPDVRTKLYNAPFFNIYEDGNVCLGTARVGAKEKTYEQEAMRFERAFFMAEQNGGTVTNRTKTPLAALWNQLIKTKKPFPSKKELVQHKKFKTLGDLLQMITGNENTEEEVYDEDED